MSVDIDVPTLKVMASLVEEARSVVSRHLQDLGSHCCHSNISVRTARINTRVVRMKAFFLQVLHIFIHVAHAFPRIYDTQL